MTNQLIPSLKTLAYIIPRVIINYADSSSRCYRHKFTRSLCSQKSSDRYKICRLYPLLNLARAQFTRCDLIVRIASKTAFKTIACLLVANANRARKTAIFSHDLHRPPGSVYRPENISDVRREGLPCKAQETPSSLQGRPAILLPVLLLLSCEDRPKERRRPISSTRTINPLCLAFTPRPIAGPMQDGRQVRCWSCHTTTLVTFACRYSRVSVRCI